MRTNAPAAGHSASLAALTAEVRQLRVAAEQLARSQTETQALGVALSAQQGRMLPVTQQLDAVRKEIDSATARSRAFDAEVATLSDELSRSTDRQQRAGLESAIRGVGAEHNRVELQLQQARARENDLSRTLALEEVHWNDALSRLEQLTR